MEVDAFADFLGFMTSGTNIYYLCLSTGVRATTPTNVDGLRNAVSLAQKF
jgi:hypothetical protein